MLGVLNLVCFLLFAAGVVLVVWPRVKPRLSSRLQSSRSRSSYGTEIQEDSSSVDRSYRRGTVRWQDSFGGSLLVLSVLLFICLQGSAQVKGNEIGIVHNSITGDYEPLEPGLRIWPFDTKLTPFVTDVEIYSTRRTEVVIGGDSPSIQEAGVASASGTVGNPNVYFFFSFWVEVNPAKIEQLHRRYGTDYRNKLVERAGIDAVKTVQGRYTYDYVASKRDAFGAEVQQEIQKSLLDADGVAFATVTDVAIINYDYDQHIREQLDTLAQKDLERQSAIADQEIATQQQITAETKADTDYNTRVRSAEADAEVKRKNADAEAYQIETKYRAEAAGIGLVQDALADSPEGYVWYVSASRWNGVMPTFVVGDGSNVPFLNVLPVGDDTFGNSQATDPAMDPNADSSKE